MIVNHPISIETTLGAGVSVLYTNTLRVAVSINSITFNNPAAYDLELTVTRVVPAGSVVAYSFTLSAGDVVKDNNLYILRYGDSISVNISVGGTNCLLYGNPLEGVTSATS